jgi:hypothetical protein
MLQAHSFLWNYLWVAPNLLFLSLAVVLWKKGLRREFPAFLAFAILSSLGDLAVFVADVTPSIGALDFWRIDWINLLIESLLKFLVIGEVFSRVFNPYSSVSKVGRFMISGLGAMLTLAAALLAGISRGDSPVPLISGFHLLEQTVFIIECGVIVFLFLFAAYFRMNWDRQSFGILLGLGISACEHLAAWALMANASLSAHERTLLDFLNMASYHVCVLIWSYYLLVPGKVSNRRPAAPPEHSLEVWNRELERLLQQ